MGAGRAPTIYIISGGVGASAEQIVLTALAQFPTNDVQISIVGNVRQVEQVTRVLEQAKESGGMVIHTLVEAGLRSELVSRAEGMGVPTIDLMGPLLDWLAGALGQEPLQQPGKYRQLHREYFERVTAIDYTLQHDDGKNPEGWPQAELMLVGVSRSGKTPLSIYLAVLGWKVANLPIVPQIPVPDALFDLDRERVLGLMIDPDQLLMYRRQRQARLGVSGGSDYTDPETIREELDLARKVFRRGSFQVIDMTDKTIEQGADEIIRRLTKTGQ